MDPILLVSLVVAEVFCLLTMISQAIEAPVGYEDAGGFHRGTEPVWPDDAEF
jgi:hypothetical protein